MVTQSGIVSADTSIKPKLNVVAEEYYPLSYLDNGKVSGSLVDLVISISYTAGMPVTRSDIQILPWSQAYVAAEQIPDTLLLGIYRTPDRENLFRWIGPVETDPSVFFVKPGSTVPLKTITDIKKLKIGVIAGDAHYEMLRLYGIQPAQIITTSDGGDLIRMVLNGDIDTFYYGERAGRALAHKVTGSPDAIKTALKFGESEIWFAMSRTTADSTVTILQDILNKSPRVSEYQVNNY
jgi:polar amino acid transport system substrate-binding protein